MISKFMSDSKKKLKLILNLITSLAFLIIVNITGNTQDAKLPIYTDYKDQSNNAINDSIPEERELMILVYMAADNDLHYFAWNNIKQMASGANKRVYIIVQLNEPGRNKRTQLYLIEKNRAVLLNKENKEKLDSGNPQTLIDFCTWSIKNFKAKKHILILSDHGSGIIDRNSARLIKPTEFFVFNPANLMLELDRSMEFLSLNTKIKNRRTDYEEQRGVCFDETHQSYFTNQKLEYALNTTCKEASKILQQEEFKFEILGMDACLMQMLELGNIVKNYAKILVASEEVELGPGWRYDKILKILEERPFEHIEFAKHIVKSYEETYAGITSDFTLSAINLERIDALEKNINSIGEIFNELLQNQKNNYIRNMLKKSKATVAFEEPSYIDIASFYINVLNNVENATNKLSDSNSLNEGDMQLLKLLQQKIGEGLKLIEQIVIENVAGNNIKYARGISIYFPEKRIHNSYKKTNFAQENQWMNFLLSYITT